MIITNMSFLVIKDNVQIIMYLLLTGNERSLNVADSANTYVSVSNAGTDLRVRCT